MKNFFIKRKIGLLFISIFAFIFVIGGLFSNYMVNQIAVHEEENITFEITGFDYNFDLSTIDAYPYLVHVTFGEGQNATLYLTKTRTLSGLQSGDEVPPSDLIDIQAEVLKASTGLDMNTYIDAFDSVTNTVVIVTAGYHDLIEVTVVFDSSFTSVIEYSVVSDESYFASIGINVPTVENYYIDGFIAGNTSLDAYAGASEGTSPAMQDLVEILTLFVNAQTGGN